MSTDFPPLPTDSARITALETVVVTLHARIEQLNQDMTASFRAQAKQQVLFEQHVDARFDALRTEMNQGFQRVEANMADGFTRIIALLEERLPQKQG